MWVWLLQMADDKLSDCKGGEMRKSTFVNGLLYLYIRYCSVLSRPQIPNIWTRCCMHTARKHTIARHTCHMGYCKMVSLGGVVLEALAICFH